MLPKNHRLLCANLNYVPAGIAFGEAMKRLLASVVGLGALAVVPAMAADLPLKVPPPVGYNWTGCYVGLSVGTNSGRTDGYRSAAGSTFTEFGGPQPPIPPGLNITDNFNLSGMMGGAQVGCNYQFAGGWVIGFEGDWSVTNKEGQSQINQVTAAAINAFRSDTFALQERWLGTARVRLGYAVTDKWLWYVTGGGAWAKIDASEWTLQPNIGAKWMQSNWVSGWTVGVGTEYAVGYGWSIRSELLYIQFRDFTTFTNVDPTTNTLTNLRVVNTRDYIWRVGMNYKFGWTPAVVAKY
jgi:outer membrane immunogenic protein